MKTRQFIQILLFAFFAGGCSTIQLADPSIKPIVLKESYKRPFAGVYVGGVQIPPGVYLPNFVTKKGVYYRAPSHLIGGLGNMNTLIRGGLYVPNSSDSDNRHGVWYDNQEAMAGLIGYYLTRPESVYRLKEQVPFETQNQ